MKKIKKGIKKKIWNYFNFQILLDKQLIDCLSNENFTSINSFKKNDIFIASYPKSGVTWLQNLLSHIILNSVSENITPKLVNELVPDIHSKSFYKRVFPTMYFKTHNLPKPEYRRVIHLVRDGRDSLISFFYYLRLNQKDGPSLSELIDMKKNIWPTKWHEHTKAWSNNPYNAQILTIKYEDLLNNPINTLKIIADFVQIKIDERVLQDIYDKNRIDQIRNRVEDYGWDYDRNFGKDSKNFFRKGEIGNYKKEFTSENLAKFESQSKEMLLKYGYEI